MESKKPRTEKREAQKNSSQKNSPLSTLHSPLIYGVLPVLESLRANSRRIEKIFVAEGAREKRLSEIFDLARQNGVLVNKISRENLARMVEPDANHQGIIAVSASADYVSADEIFDAITANALLVVLDGVEDPRNLGAVLRSVEGAGADGVFIPERRAVGLTETVAKSSAGAIEYVKVAKVANINRLIEELKERNIWTIGTSAEAETDYTDWDWTQASALVLGGEGKGLHRLTAEKCDVLVKIPMHGKIESLNVSVACGVILFEAIRQRVQSLKLNVQSSKFNTQDSIIDLNPES
ncbi:MAG: 23S rRNA (guanosine(2251)-2'-O)-methyltransferase RlmB [Acidobacteriota bacterium]|nr:23S rRNA (guanosine(2251)-2'-O)-methyltransferase RlmB [Acidobacteriota bacterium]